MSKLCVLTRKHDVAVADEFGATGQTEAMDLGDGRLWQGPQPLPSFDGSVQTEPIVGDGESGPRVLGSLQIVTCGKCPARTADNQNARLRVGGILVHDLIEFRQQ